jgi:hypothetical protein
VTGKYTVELCSPGGPDVGIEGVIASHDDLMTARNSTALPLLPIPNA